MPIDPNLALAFSPTTVGPDIGKALRDAQAMWDLQATRQQYQSQNALKSIPSFSGENSNSVGLQALCTRALATDTKQERWIQAVARIGMIASRPAL